MHYSKSEGSRFLGREVNSLIAKDSVPILMQLGFRLSLLLPRHGKKA
jgi:hypothetical protein